MDDPRFFEETAERRQRTFKATRDGARERRERCLQRQKDRRRDMLVHARRVARLSVGARANISEESKQADEAFSEDFAPDPSPQDEDLALNEMADDADMSSSSSPSSSHRHSRDFKERQARRRRLEYAREFMLPDWLNDIPEDLCPNWYVMPRPEGVRCLVTSYGGKTVSRKRNGNLLHRFQSALPNGSRHSKSKSQFSLLDCIYHHSTRTYYVLDFLVWNSVSMYDNDFDCRQFLLHSRLTEVPISEVTQGNRYRFRPVPTELVSLESLQKAYQGEFEFQKDGLLFYHRDSSYEGGPNPLMLVWKDRHSSPYFVDTDDGVSHTPQQFVSLALHADGTSLRTFEDVPLGTITSELLQQEGIRSGGLVKMSILDIDSSQANPTVCGLQFVSKSSLSRVVPDQWSKILFQHNARSGASTTFDQLVEAVSHQQETNPERTC